MDIGSIFLILALLVLVAIFVSRPFFETNTQVAAQAAGTEDQKISSLLAERDRLLNALQELDFDHALGKIPDEDYPAQRTFLLQQGADVLRQLDQLQPANADDDFEARIEAVIAARRADAARAASQTVRARVETVAQVAAPDDDLELMLASRRRERQEKAAGFCPQCGGPVQKSDRFCPKCGARLD